MTGADDLRFDTDFLDVLVQHVRVGDGAMGTQSQTVEPSLDGFCGSETKYVRQQSG